MQHDALYYPHIALNNPSLIKAMALFYDSIYRIVPNNVIPEDAQELNALLEDGAVGRMIDPAPYSIDASDNFLTKIEDYHAAALTFDAEDERQISRLHSDKTDERVRELFRESGFQSENDWMHIPTAIVSNYMLFLAGDIAQKNQLSLITADWGAWTGTSYFGVDGQVDDFIVNIGKDTFDEGKSEAFGLFSLIVSELVPVNIEEIPSEKILEFRNKRRPEILQFRSCMSDLRTELSKLDSQDVKVGVIQEKAKQLHRAQEQYKQSADIIKAKGWFGVSLMGFPAPLIFGQLLSIPSASSIALGATGLALGGIFNIHNTKEELRKLNEKNPASFLVDMRKSFKNYTKSRGGGDMNFHAYNCMEEYIND